MPSRLIDVTSAVTVAAGAKPWASAGSADTAPCQVPENSRRSWHATLRRPSASTPAESRRRDVIIRRLDELAEVSGGAHGLDVEAALLRNLESGAGWVGDPGAGPVEPRDQLAAHHGHALGAVGAEVVLAGCDDA